MNRPALPPPKKAPPPTSGNSNRHADAIASPSSPLTISRGMMHGIGQKIVVYSCGGAGKSTLCSLLSNVGIDPLFIDVEDSSKFLDVARVTPTSWDDVRSALHDKSLTGPFGAIVVESLTKLEELAIDWTKANIPHEKGKPVYRLEDYGFGKGYAHVFETYLNLLGDLDALARDGKHIVCTAHDCTEKVPNPSGEDFLQYQPRLQSPPKQGKLREKVKEWCDHLLHLAYDRYVEDGKAQGSGTRTIYPSEAATFWAKSRTLSEPIPYAKGDAELWRQLFQKGIDQ